jgi:hypothetical protein
VACTDVKLNELLKEVEFFEEGNSSYAFMIDHDHDGSYNNATKMAEWNLYLTGNIPFYFINDFT